VAGTLHRAVGKDLFETRLPSSTSNTSRALPRAHGRSTGPARYRQGDIKFYRAGTPTTVTPTAPERHQPGCREPFQLARQLSAARRQWKSAISPGWRHPLYSTAAPDHFRRLLAISGAILPRRAVDWVGRTILPTAPRTPLNGVSVSINGNPAFISHVSPSSYSYQAPTIRDRPVQVVVTSARTASDPVSRHRKSALTSVVAPFAIQGK